MLNIQHFCCSEYGWKLDYCIDEANLISMFLLMRQKMFTDGAKGITLTDKEMIKKTMDAQKSWEELILQNRLQLMKQMQNKNK